MASIFLSHSSKNNGWARKLQAWLEAKHHRSLFLDFDREAGLKVEPSGAATTAALLSGKVRPRGATVVVVSGGNVDEELFDRLMSAE